MAEFLRNVDDLYFNNGSLSQDMVIAVRSALSRRLMASSGWKHLSGSRLTSIERRIGPAIATLFFNNYDGFVQPPNCYLLPKGIDRLDPFLPILEKLIKCGPSLFVAILSLNLFEVSPRPSLLQFILSAGNVWMKSYSDGIFWVDQDLGHRVCALIEAIWCLEPTLLDSDRPLRLEVDRLLSALISLGIADASQLESALINRSENKT
jgi:hypothetical protein